MGGALAYFASVIRFEEMTGSPSLADEGSNRMGVILSRLAQVGPATSVGGGLGGWNWRGVGGGELWMAETRCK